MIRFRNPISDMAILIENFKKMYNEFSDMDYFDLDNIAEFFAKEQLASSSGYIGDEALRRSYRIKDDSRKSMKMQAKSYSELFRLLGWITSGKKALNFNFTYLGVHVALSDNGAAALFEQCLLGIEYPNNNLDVKFSDINKPFVSILLFADELDGKIHRDEILLGPMNMSNGYDMSEVEDKVKFLQELRNVGSINALNGEIQKLARKNHMQANSVRNLTRFVISSLDFAGWFKKERLSIYGRPSVFLVLTPKGKNVVSMIKASYNIKGADIDLEEEKAKELAEIALLCMFKRADFDVEHELAKHELFLSAFYEETGKTDILFSPFQFYSKEILNKLLPHYVLSSGTEHHDTKVVSDIDLYTLRTEAIIESKKRKGSKNEKISRRLENYLQAANGDTETAVSYFMNKVSTMKQSAFYPLIADLLGYVFNRNAFAPSAGNNNMRYDVMIPDDENSIPVEVKSPTEEVMLSAKAIRQALENKILLLARKPYPTTYSCSSIACGFKLPNDRSDVYKLIDEIYETYQINISLLDVETLFRAAIYCHNANSCYEINTLVGERGVIKFENI